MIGILLLKNLNETHRGEHVNPAAALQARRLGLAAIIGVIERVHRASDMHRLSALGELAQTLPMRKDDLESWLLVEIETKSKLWIEELESALFNGQNAGILIKLLPPFYEVLGIPDRAGRTERLRQRAIQVLMKEKQFAQALAALEALPERQIKLEAVCREGLGNFRKAAEQYRAVGCLKEALNCYRSIPDLPAALQLLREIGDHPATESLEWMAKLQDLVARRPEKFTRMVTPAEKKILEELLERSLGVARRKPAPVKRTAKAAATPRKRSPRKTKSAEELPF